VNPLLPAPCAAFKQYSGRDHYDRATFCHLFDLQFPFRDFGQSGLAGDSAFRGDFPASWLEQPWLQSLLAIALTLVVLYVVDD